MSTEVTAALIAAGGTLIGGLLTSFVNRQGAKDLRANIEREISIAQKLSPGADETTQLEKHISKSIYRLIERENRREQLASRWWLFVAALGIATTLYGFNSLRIRGMPEDFRLGTEIINGLLWVAFAWFIIQVLVSIYAAAKPLAKIGYLTTRLTWMRRRYKVLSRRVAKSRRTFDAVRKYDRYVTANMNARKDEIIAEKGQEWWNTMMAERARLDEWADDIEATYAEPLDPNTSR